jgi:hypothetical protein
VILIGSLTFVGAAAIFIGGMLIRAFGGAASSILADEFKASAPEAAQKIIRVAARRIPEHAREDILETWLAEASEYEGRPLKALRFALINCLAAAPAVARQLRPALAPAGNGKNNSGARNQTRARRTGSDLARRELQSARKFLRLANRSSQDSFRLAAGSVAVLGQPFAESVRRVARLVEGFLDGFSAPFVGLVRVIIELGGPYDYSREWRSLLQLLVKTIAVVSGVVFGVVVFFFVAEVVFGL